MKTMAFGLGLMAITVIAVIPYSLAAKVYGLAAFCCYNTLKKIDDEEKIE